MSDRRARRHAATRQEILEAAWSLARERGLTGWSLREVAEAVGMRAPSLYVYFDRKDAIYDAMYAQGYRQLVDRIEQVDLDGPPRELARRAAHEFFHFAVADAARYQLLFLRVVPGFEPSPESYRLAEELLERLREVLADAGLTDPSSVDLWTAALTGLASQQLSNDPGGERWARLLDRTVDLLLTSEESPALGATER